ncbi:Glucan endo-1,3-beta-glucosidase A1 precursor [Legionella busanensis]|uniref:Glucan endo-1,3-beta-glucosidase A1 n=1 Tax=Legionella busanensis TaxID=190655 RepID=A0A378JQB3_9GAMM|nr:glycoside hydrolase family 16 protein [Legionella busanensis]STX52878.1 Glucan endo-1,3-beta-glucosidase A1 precursor [Legionella busanensis]
MKGILASTTILLATNIFAAPCSFDENKQCSLVRNILTDKNKEGLNYYAATNYDHRKSGEINVYDSSLVSYYVDKINAPGQLKLSATKINDNYWKAGEIMTRRNLTAPPYNATVNSTVWDTSTLSHGYLEVIAKLPRCESSDDGLCEARTNPVNYHSGLWPAIWLLPTNDKQWPTNGEIDIMEAYPKNTSFDIMTAALHFNGKDPSCNGGDCKGPGYRLIRKQEVKRLYNDFHKWGFEWNKDPQSIKGGYIITGYYDNKKIWGPLKTDSLPADGANALSRGFNDKEGGFYLIVNLAIGGPYAGPPNPHMKTASMFVQSIKSYKVATPTLCKPPANISASYTKDKKSITLKWQKPEGSLNITNYQVRNWMQQTLWEGKTLTWTENTLPGRSGKFTYYLNSQCGAEVSELVKYEVFIS